MAQISAKTCRTLDIEHCLIYMWLMVFVSPVMYCMYHNVMSYPKYGFNFNFNFFEEDRRLENTTIK